MSGAGSPIFAIFKCFSSKEYRHRLFSKRQNNRMVKVCEKQKLIDTTILIICKKSCNLCNCQRSTYYKTRLVISACKSCPPLLIFTFNLNSKHSLQRRQFERALPKQGLNKIKSNQWLFFDGNLVGTHTFFSLCFLLPAFAKWKKVVQEDIEFKKVSSY